MDHYDPDYDRDMHLLHGDHWTIEKQAREMASLRSTIMFLFWVIIILATAVIGLSAEVILGH